jgi:hypothetical protein
LVLVAVLSLEPGLVSEDPHADFECTKACRLHLAVEVVDSLLTREGLVTMRVLSDLVTLRNL